MRKVAILADSTCDLPREVVRARNIHIIPLYVSFDKEVFRDGEDITPEEMYQKVEKLGYLPKTSCASPEDFRMAFQQYIDQDMDLIFIGISSQLSATVQNAHLIASEYPEGRIQIIDGKNLSTGTGLLVLKACRFRDEGMTASEIVKQVTTLIPYVRSQFVLQTLDYLHKGGRCSGITRFVGSLLRICPNIKVVDGGMVVARKPRGKKIGLNLMVDDVLESLPQIDRDTIMLTHTVARSDYEYIYNRLRTETDLPSSILMESHAGCVIASHCGPGCIGILYIEYPVKE